MDATVFYIPIENARQAAKAAALRSTPQRAGALLLTEWNDKQLAFSGAHDSLQGAVRIHVRNDNSVGVDAAAHRQHLRGWQRHGAIRHIGPARSGNDHPLPISAMSGAGGAAAATDASDGGSSDSEAAVRVGPPDDFEWHWWNYPFKSWAAATKIALPAPVAKVSAGYAHVVLLTANGESWTFGNGEFGQLGRGSRDSVPFPDFVRCLYGRVIVDVAAGGWHSHFVDASGVIHSCGDNRYGQLGLGHCENQVLPTPVSVEHPKSGAGPEDTKFRAAAAGLFHSLFLSNTSCVWSVGFNRYGQLGLRFRTGESESRLRPLLAYQNVEPKQVACGSHHSMMITEGGDLWTWGRGSAGQLGHGSTAHEAEPRLLKVLQGKFMISAAGGDYHTVCCAESGGTHDSSAHDRCAARGPIPQVMTVVHRS
jgi:hypothetical protein